MKAYHGVVKGKTIILEESADLPEGIRAQIVIKPIKPTLKEIVREQVKLMEEAPLAGAMLYKKREELHE